MEKRRHASFRCAAPMLGRRGTSLDLILISTGPAGCCGLNCLVAISRLERIIRRDVRRKLPWTPHLAPRCWPCGLGTIHTSSSKLFDTTLYLSKPFAMIADVLMDNSHASHQSENLPQTVSSTNLSTLSAQPQNASDAQLTLDEMVDQILVKAESQLEEGEARATVEALEKVRRKCRRTIYRHTQLLGADVRSQIFHEPTYAKAMSTRTREDLWRIRYPPQLLCHPRIQATKAGVLSRLIRRLL